MHYGELATIVATLSGCAGLFPPIQGGENRPLNDYLQYYMWLNGERP